MAEREALRDFQRRLADRLQAASAQGGQVAWLAVQARGQRFLIPLAQAGEIFPAAGAHPVPHTQSWFLGVANLRGGLYGVADLAGLVDSQRHPSSAAPAPPPLPAGPGAEAQLVTFNPAFELQCALRVDHLAGLRGPGDFTASEPVPAAAPPWFSRVHRDTSGLSWQTLDLEQLARQPRFLHIGA